MEFFEFLVLIALIFMKDKIGIKNIACYITKISIYFFQISSKDTFDTLSALDISEQLTYLDHKIFLSIRSE